jgi:hypothetical protein
MTLKYQVEKINKQADQIREITQELKKELQENKVRITDIELCKYTHKDIIFQSNIGQVEMSYSDAFELMYTTLDALGILTPEVEELLIYADKKYNLDKF